MGNVRVMPPATGSTTTTVNGRTYTAALGSTIDVPDFDGRALSANGWTVVEPHGVGNTASRPANPKLGTHYLDTDVGASIVFDGKTWRNKVTGATV